MSKENYLYKGNVQIYLQGENALLPVASKTRGDQVDFFILQFINQTKNISRQFLYTIAIDPFGFVTQVIAALVRDNNSTTSTYQGWQLSNPATPVFGKAME